MSARCRPFVLGAEYNQWFISSQDLQTVWEAVTDASFQDPGSLSHDYPCGGDKRLDFLALANTEHFRPAGGADALGGGLTIFHGNGFGILHFSLGTIFHAICLH